MRKHWHIWLMLLVALLLAAIPVIAGMGGDGEEKFGGADGRAEETIAEIDADYEPWFSLRSEDLPGEVESGLFALQAALGAGVVAYVLGVYRGRQKEREESGADSTRSVDSPTGGE